MAVQQTEVGAASFYGWIVTRASTNAIRFDGQVAVIVGAGPGLGATLAGRFAANGANIAIVARSEYSLQAARSAAAAASARTETLAIGADMTVPVDAIRMADAVFERFGRVDVLVNLAFGVTPRRNVLDMDTEALELWRRVVEVGGYGTLLASRYLAPEMVRCGRGAIVNVTSMSSRIGFAGRSEYAAGKVQAHKIAHALADELGPHGVRINCVAPGHIRSEQLLTYYRTCARERDVGQQQRIPSLNRYAVDHSVFIGGPHERRDGTDPANHFLHGQGQRTQVHGQLHPLVGILDQRT